MDKINICDIDGFFIGNAEDTAAATGCTVILCPEGAVAGVDVRGGGPATRETELLRPTTTPVPIHAVMMSGGSAFGLNAASGAMRFLEERGIGYSTKYGLVPLVCAASIYDLGIGDPGTRPDLSMGYAACENAFARSPLVNGSYGAGTGATVGKYHGAERMMKSGIAYHAVRIQDIDVGIVVVVNALGDIIAENGSILAGLLDPGLKGFSNTTEEMIRDLPLLKPADLLNNTTLATIITNVKLDKAAAGKIASLAHNGFARAIRPVHTSVDGDAAFVLSTNKKTADLDTVGAVVSDVTALAIRQAALCAEPAYGLKSARDMAQV